VASYRRGNVVRVAGAASLAWLTAGVLLLPACRREPAPLPSGARLFHAAGLEAARVRIWYQTREAYAARPAVPFTFTVRPGPASVLQGAIGVACPGREPCAGVWRFTLEEGTSKSRRRLFERTLDAARETDWVDVRIPLDSGRTVTLTFGVSEVVPGTARPLWGEARLLRPPASPPQNVLLISVDTLRADRLGCYGYARPTSPNIDGLAAEGVRFGHAISQSSWTTPSHASLLTSQYPSSHRLNQGWQQLEKFQKEGKGYRVLAEGATTLAEVLRENGYRTMALTGGATLAGELGFAQGFDAYRVDSPSLGEKPRQVLGQWLAESREVPFFIFFHTFEVHAPYGHAEMAESLLTDPEREAVRRGARRDAAGFESLLRKLGLFRREVTSALYDGGIRCADAFLGGLLGELRRLRLDERTLIVFTSDHGEEFGEHHPERFYNAHCNTVYDELIHVPLILRLPGKVPAGGVVDAPVELVDVAPTILDYLGIVVPSSMQGKSLKKLVARPGRYHKEWTLSESTCLGPEVKTLRSRGTKYVATYEARGEEHAGVPGPLLSEELFDLASDPGETRSLPGPRLRGKLRAILEARAKALERDAIRAAEAPVSADVLERVRGLGYIQ